MHPSSLFMLVHFNLIIRSEYFTRSKEYKKMPRVAKEGEKEKKSEGGRNEGRYEEEEISNIHQYSRRHPAGFCSA